MTTKNGNLDDGRAVYFAGGKLSALTEVPVFVRTLATIQKYYTLRAEDPEMSLSDGTSTLFKLPRSAADLTTKRRAYEKIARLSYGMLGRTPDFVDSGVAVVAEYASVLGAPFAAHVKKWASRVVREDLFVSHAIQNPQKDRSKSLSALLADGDEFAGVWIKERLPDGVIVRGAKQVSTLAPLADELLIFNLPGLLPEDEKFALAFVVPLDAPGMKTICRKPTMPDDADLRDYPLSGSFDEMDAVTIFDDVFVPNEALFVCGDVAMSNAFFEASGLFVHTAHQDEVRGVVKLEFATALAVRLAEKLGLIGFARVQEMLGELSVNLELIRAAVVASEVTGHLECAGRVFTPNMQTLLAVRASLTSYYDEVVRVIAEFSSGSAVGIPDFRTFEHAEIGTLVSSALTSAHLDAKERALLMNLAWDVSASSFGQRQRTYEFLHGGNPFVIKTQHWLTEDLSAGSAMLDEILRTCQR
ncbi:MAG: 4-hydroxyphenylacetate 3-hydroxylase [Streptococcaceae bacterium]|jgi:4-hydroxyphenylacetate 3-monooxygenase|nr:4-hydroxyphenylacetate 3-hydroxylase [Streptococcaceae bacterium]